MMASQSFSDLPSTSWLSIQRRNLFGRRCFDMSTCCRAPCRARVYCNRVDLPKAGSRAIGGISDISENSLHWSQKP